MPRRRRGTAARLVYGAAITVAGAGAGTAAALAASDSWLIRGGAGAAGGIAALLSAAWIDTVQQRKEAAATADEERGRVLDPVISEPARDLSVLGLLLPTRETAAPFRGRAADLSWLESWQEDLDAHPVALVTGAGGTGKTRLVTQFATTRPEHWATGWLHPGCGAAAVAAVRACGDPALILIDDADTSPDAAALLTDLAGQPEGTRVRVLLTAGPPTP